MNSSRLIYYLTEPYLATICVTTTLSDIAGEIHDFVIQFQRFTKYDRNMVILSLAEGSQSLAEGVLLSSRGCGCCHGGGFGSRNGREL